MKEEGRISGRRVSLLMLERYRLGEVTEEERKLVEAEKALDEELRLRYDGLEESDRELRMRYPLKQTLRALPAIENYKRLRSRGRVTLLFAAAILFVLFFPSVNQIRLRWFGEGLTENQEAGNELSERVKGTEIKAELSIFLKETLSNTAMDEGRILSNKSQLAAGNTVQLAYTIPPGKPYYGVIFSIDGRSTVTLHYPYQIGQSTVLTAGKRTFLGEAYTLDDAPDFEIFFMVISQSPLDTRAILSSARALALDPVTALSRSAAVFSDCDLETFTVLKRK